MTLCNSCTLPWMVHFLLLNFLIVHIHSLLKMYQLNSLLWSRVWAIIIALARANIGLIVTIFSVSMDILSYLLCTYGSKYSSKKTQKPPLKDQLPRKGFIDAIDNLLCVYRNFLNASLFRSALQTENQLKKKRI